MRCSICDKEINFLEWFRYNYSCKECFLKEKKDKQKRIEKNRTKEHSEKIKRLKEQYPKRNKKALIYSGIFSVLITLSNPQELLFLPFYFIFIFGIIKAYHFFKYRPLKKI